MIKSIKILFLRIIGLVFISWACISCSSADRTLVKIVEPSKDGIDTTQWYLYYKQELSISQGAVVAPSDLYPPAAKEGYKKAFSEWQINTTFTVFGLTLLVPIYTLAFAFVLYIVVFH